MISENFTRVKDYLIKTKLKTPDYVINPYVGCPNNCLYCYAAYMASFSKHKEKWGNFIDVKITNKKINTFKIKDKKIVVGTVTDPYNVYEEKHKITRIILEQLVKSEAHISIVTKSKLVTRDIDLFKQMKDVKVAMSICTMDENLKSKLEFNSSSIQERLDALKELKENNIKTVVFIAPIIPEFTDFKYIIEKTKDLTDEYWFDKLNLRSSFKTKMFNFIKERYPSLETVFDNIYNKKNSSYFENKNLEIKKYCEENNINYKILNAGT